MLEHLCRSISIFSAVDTERADDIHAQFYPASTSSMREAVQSEADGQLDDYH
jgi:hypothetical protein